ncbi:hypothetical protein SAMN05660772_01863 [Pasteurella testudinis DSM 23072]|uniref:DUF6378 domain-containing protein n=1 Tax=Pasteurella testudinis DSM 23072 TaxID=1122938 RepID=A0A1W1UKA4_9PAST|nr:DUF6378 domain-containing protein [Pasteurella testudinis]SMB81469.1 hypothetical protein SAMN05660772_01863 [Pasteurella testudinis DSM 23072]SUB51421.1 Uncharacterised protein [Pasteurella testudinis]
MNDINQTLTDREQTHGAFAANANTSQLFKLVARQNPKWQQLSDTQREAIEMILHKVSRAINGDHKHADNYHDIAGYAALVEKELNAPEAKSEPEPTE